MVPGSPDQIFTYEFDFICATPNNFLQFVRWDGSQGTFTALGSSINIPDTQDGDVFRCRATGPQGNVVLTAWRNDVLIGSFNDTDATLSIGSGRPGMGFEYRSTPDAGLEVGFKRYEAYNL